MAKLILILIISLCSRAIFAEGLETEKLPVELRSYSTWKSFPNLTVTLNEWDCFVPPFAQYKFQPKGLHRDKFLSVFINGTGEGVVGYLRKHKFPIGSAIVKEKKLSPDASPHAAGVMLKREEGYDETIGNWEFMYLSETGEFTRGKEKTSSCINCHRDAKQTDFVFGNYGNKPSN